MFFNPWRKISKSKKKKLRCRESNPKLYQSLGFDCFLGMKKCEMESEVLKQFETIRSRCRPRSRKNWTLQIIIKCLTETFAAWVCPKKTAPLSRQCLSVSHPEGRGSKGRTIKLRVILGMDHWNSDGTHHRLTLVNPVFNRWEIRSLYNHYP